ncbi:MAG: Sb-PDE family phosphodiesterase [Gammaproteobacteria bacterium]|nr:Sb-PDE family phosphodiesterase [Gammaproteobacteria bacterium]
MRLRFRRLAGIALTGTLLGWMSVVLGHGTAGAPAKSARAIEFPDTDQYQTLVVDLHTHSVFSDGHVWPKIRVGEALRDGLDAYAVTEHLEWQPHLADIPHPDRNRSYQESVAAAAGSDLIVISGSEITRREPAGHMNAVFIEDANALLKVGTPPEDSSDTIGHFLAADQWPPEQAVMAASAQGAFVFWNHPYYTRIYPNAVARMTDFHRTLIDQGHLHGIEVVNGNTYSEEAFQIALDYDLALIGVSDIHDLIDWDYRPEAGGHRPVNLVFAEERTAEAIQAALFARRTVIWFKNLLIGRAADLAPLLDASLDIVDARYRPDLEIVDLTIENHSDANLVLKNLTDYTFVGHADYIQVPPHGMTRVTVRPGKVVDTLELEFEVVNALTAPKQHPRMRYSIPVADVPEP